MGTSLMGKVSTVVDTGCLAQLSKDSLINQAAPMKPAITMQIQRSLSCLVVVETVDGGGFKKFC